MTISELRARLAVLEGQGHGQVVVSVCGPDHRFVGVADVVADEDGCEIELGEGD